MRDIEKQPYSPDEARVAKFFADRGTGGGDDPIGSILASHEYLIAQRKEMRAALDKIAHMEPSEIAPETFPGLVHGSALLFANSQRIAREALRGHQQSQTSEQK